MKKFTTILIILAVALIAGTAYAQAPSGAIFTTVVDGTEVNLNQYAAKEDVYLDGGPGPGAPQTAAGLDDGIYVFQVTDPSGKILLSTDNAVCRQFEVSNGIIVSVAPSGGCAHATGIDVDHGALTVQLMPYLDTPNKGGVYKVWVTLQEDYLEGCARQDISDGLDVVDCGPLTRRSGGVAHGFIPSESKTDNYKVKSGPPREIDCRFVSSSGKYMDGLEVIWYDTVGASNKKWSVWAPQLLAFHEAHIENAETGDHRFEIYDQAGCTVQQVVVDGELMPDLGPQVVDVLIKPGFKTGTKWVDIYCK
jgi:hypothetical protein